MRHCSENGGLLQIFSSHGDPIGIEKNLKKRHRCIRKGDLSKLDMAHNAVSMTENHHLYHGHPWTIYDHLCSSIVHKCHQHFFFAVLRLILTLRPEGQANPGAFCRPKISNAVAAKVYWTTHIKPSICVMASGAQSELLSPHDRPTSL